VCHDGNWSPQALRCMSDATTGEALEDCARTHLAHEEYGRAGAVIDDSMNDDDDDDDAP
jgi:hypothetical protein